MTVRSLHWPFLPRWSGRYGGVFLTFCHCCPRAAPPLWRGPQSGSAFDEQL